MFSFSFFFLVCMCLCLCVCERLYTCTCVCFVQPYVYVDVVHFTRTGDLPPNREPSALLTLSRSLSLSSSYPLKTTSALIYCFEGVHRNKMLVSLVRYIDCDGVAIAILRRTFLPRVSFFPVFHSDRFKYISRVTRATDRKLI